jgi:putative ABC transport system permease protein
MASYHRETKRIVGVTDDFHYLGMQEMVDPLILDIENSLMNTITLSIKVTDMSELMHFIRSKWTDHFPGVPFEFAFLDQNFEAVYRYEERMGRLLGIITGLGFAIACLGLFGLTSFVTRQKTKEIGIRKVLGASDADIVSLLSKKFITLILFAILLALPLAWYGSTLWLQDFAYRITVPWLAFIFASSGALLVALATISIHALRVANSNPATALRNE